MIIELTGDRRLTSDEHQYSLEKRRVQRGEERWVPYRYYGSLAAALKALPEQLLRESTAHGFNEVNLFLNELKTLLNNKIRSK